MTLQRYFAFFDEYLGGIGFFLANPLALEVCIRLRETETENNDQNWGTGAEPEQWSPSVTDSIDERAREDGCHEVSESITLLEHAGYETACEGRAVFKCYTRDNGG
jgi:hypothetical protein